MIIINNKDFYNKLAKALSSVYISVTDKCNIRCRHCSERDGTVLPDPNPQNVIDWISQIADTSECNHVMFVGGEPFLLQENLRKYIQHANKLKLITTVITNGYWAETKQTAIEVLKSLPGLNCIIVSSDLYHLEFIDKEVINNLIEACVKMGIVVTINITAASREEGEKIKEIYKHFQKHNVQIVISPMFSWGAATKLTIEKFKYLNDLATLEEHCEISNHYIDNVGKVYACCGATLGNKTDFLYLGDLKDQSYQTIIRNRNANPLYKFIDSYGPRGIGGLISDSPYFDKLQDMEFTHGCNLCTTVFNDKNMYQYILKVLREPSA